MDIISYILGMTAEKEKAENGGAEGEKNYLYKNVSIEPTANSGTFTHGCGVVPDIIFMIPTQIPKANKICFACGFSSKLIEALGGGYIAPVTYLLSSGGAFSYKNNAGMDAETQSNTAVTYGSIRNVDENYFTVGSDKVQLATGETYNVYCICGLM